MKENKKTNIITVVNKKGGCGKTTTVVNIAAALALKEKNVLAIDLDPQGNLSNWLKFFPDGKPTVAEMIFASVGNMNIDYSNYIRSFDDENFDYLPSLETLDGIPSYLASKSDCKNIIAKMLSAEFFNKYDYILLDCSSASDLLLENAISASNNLLIPVQVDILSYNQVDNLLQTLVNVKRDTDVTKYILGMVATMYYTGTRHSADVYDALKSSYGKLVFKSYISYRTEAKNAVGYGRSSVSDAKSKIGIEYISVADEIISRLEG